MIGLRWIRITLDENYNDFVRHPPTMDDPWVARLLSLQASSRARIQVLMGLKEKSLCFERTAKETELRRFDCKLKKELEVAKLPGHLVIDIPG